MTQQLVWFEQLGMRDVPRVGGKNASLGEMIGGLAHAGVRVPGGFATTADAYREFLGHDGLAARIAARLAALDVDDVAELARAGAEIRGWIRATPLPAALRDAVAEAYARLGAGKDIAVAVRSSATAEDLPDASFAGQQETYLNICGLERVVEAVHEVFASLFNDRAISYRVHKGFDHGQVALSAGVQRMVRSETGASGVMFTLDTESGFEGAVFITAAYGLGETVVQGAVNPDEFYVFKHGLHEGKAAILRRNLGDKKIRMVYTAEIRGRRHHGHRAGARGVAAPVLHLRRGSDWSSVASRCASRSTTVVRWTSNGRVTATTAGSTCCRRDPKPCAASREPAASSATC